MATSGDENLCGSVTEEFEYKHTCLPCETEGQKIRAVGYCLNCREYLCQRCYDVHLIPSQTRRHVLVDEENMADIAIAMLEAKANKCTERCLQHPDELVNYHCPTHSFIGCHICCFKNHKTCTDVQYIPEVSQRITGTTEYHGFANRVENITEKASQLMAEIKTATEANKTCHKTAVAGIKDFKKELLDAIDKLEKELLEKADRAQKDRAAELSELADKVNNVLTENQKIASQTEILLNKHQHCDLYTAMVQLKDKLLALENNLHAAERDRRPVHFEYASNKELLEYLKSPFGLGNLYERGVLAEVKHLIDVNCKTGSDGNNCRIIGSVLLPDHKLVLTDQYNHKVKLVNTRQNKVVADLTVQSWPLGVCKITNTQVAVAAAGEHKIVFVETEPSLHTCTDKELKVDGQCGGVGYIEGKLVVSFYDSHKVEIMDLQGRVLKKIQIDVNGQNLFSHPHHLAINHYSKLVYVSNYSTHNIVCLNLDGTVAAKYANSELQGPWQVVIDEAGKLFAIGRNSANVHQITEDCKMVKVFLTKTDGLTGPESIAYNEKDDTLYIGQNSNALKVFKLTFKTL